jgi:putative sugar O-methyltransferase
LSDGAVTADDPLWLAFDFAHRLHLELQGRDQTQSSHASAFWRDRLDNRENYPGYEDLVNFRRGFASSVGYVSRIDDAAEMARTDAAFERAKAIVGIPHLCELEESKIGSPLQFAKEGVMWSAAGLNNAASFGLVENAWRQYAGKLAPDSVLEIGAGYGALADLAIRRWRPRTYVICDLPENLYLAIFFLSANHPQLKVSWLLGKEKLTEDSEGIVFVLPESIGQVAHDFDLVVNTYSFQEMEKAEVDRYFSYVSNHLTENGIFYSLNHFGASGIQQPADYPFERFHLRHWAPVRIPAASLWLRKQHFEAVLTRGNGDRALPLEFAGLARTIGLLCFMGLGDHLHAICRRLMEGNLNHLETAALAVMTEVLAKPNITEAVGLLDQEIESPELVPIFKFVRGVLNLIDGRPDQAVASFEESIAAGLSGLALVRAWLGLAVAGPNDGRRSILIENARAVLPQFAGQIDERVLSLPKLSAVFRFCFPALSWRDTP